MIPNDKAIELVFNMDVFILADDQEEALKIQRRISELVFNEEDVIEVRVEVLENVN